MMRRSAGPGLTGWLGLTLPGFSLSCTASRLMWGRVMSPTLALLVQREADIGAFVSKPFYVPEITCGGFTASGEKLAGKKPKPTQSVWSCDGQACFGAVRGEAGQDRAAAPPL